MLPPANVIAAEVAPPSRVAHEAGERHSSPGDGRDSILRIVTVVARTGAVNDPCGLPLEVGSIHVRYRRSPCVFVTRRLLSVLENVGAERVKPEKDLSQAL
jgi:hypothetical protein